MRNQKLILLYTLFAILTACGLYVCIAPIVNLSVSVMQTDCIIGGVVLTVLTIFLINGLKYGHFDTLLFTQRLIIYSAMSILYVACWVGISSLILYLCFAADDWNALSSSIPLRIVIGFLVYSVIVLSASHLINREEEELGTDDKTDAYEDEITEIQTDNESEYETIIEHVAVKNGAKIDVIPVSDISHLQAEGDYVMIYTMKGKFLKEQTMKAFDNTLPKNKFVRVHRSNIVNIDYISQIELYEKQSQLLKLKGGAQVKISMSGYRLLKKTLGL